MGSTKFEIRSTKTWSVSNFGFRVSDFPHSGLASSPPHNASLREMRANCPTGDFLQFQPLDVPDSSQEIFPAWSLLIRRHYFQGSTGP